MPLSDPTSRTVPPFVRPIILALLAVALGLVLLVVVRRPPAAEPVPTPAPTPQTTPAPQNPPAPKPDPFTLNTPPTQPALQPITYLEPGIGPITFYLDKCASCHGAYGSYYYENDILMEERGQISREGLLSQVRLMAETNAQVLLTDPQLEPLAAYVSTFPDVADTDVAVDGPFVAFTGWSAEDHVLSGEVTPDSSVAIETSAGDPTPATVTGHQWTVALDPSVDPSQVVVVATLGGKEARLHLNKGTFAIPQ